MKNQSLIINDNNTLYEVLFEVSEELNCSVSKLIKKNFIKMKTSKDLNYLILIHFSLVIGFFSLSFR